MMVLGLILLAVVACVLVERRAEALDEAVALEDASRFRHVEVLRFCDCAEMMEVG